ncbi:MAG TPA: hypothetical protein VF028_08220 [Actinomycetota bacterium]|nr:hypothetical protein [Actinomycetota bacterium]
MTSLLIGTRNGLFGLENGAAPVPDPSLGAQDVTAVDVGPGGEVRAVVDRHAIVGRDASGTWPELARSDDLAIDCLLSTPTGVLAGTDEAHVLRLADDGSFERDGSFDAIEGRDAWYTPWGGPPAVRSMAVDLAGRIHANVHVGGIPRSGDGGASWEPTIEIDADIHQVIAHPTQADIVLAAGAVGLAISENGGTSWRIEADGLHSSYARAVAVAGDTILLTAATGPHGGRGAVYRIPIEGIAFEKCADGLPGWFDGNIDSGWLVADGAAVAFGTSTGDVFLSEDEGRTWGRAAEGLPQIRALAFG